MAKATRVTRGTRERVAKTAGGTVEREAKASRKTETKERKAKAKERVAEAPSTLQVIAASAACGDTSKRTVGDR
eukprot:5262854-Amphidinium_carterae.1